MTVDLHCLPIYNTLSYSSIKSGGLVRNTEIMRLIFGLLMGPISCASARGYLYI